MTNFETFGGKKAPKNLRMRSSWVSTKIHLSQSLMLANNGCFKSECNKLDVSRAIPPLAIFYQQPEAEGHPESDLVPDHHAYQPLGLFLHV